MSRRKAHIASLLPDITHFERYAKIRRDIEKPGTAPSDLAVKDGARDGVVRTNKRVLLEPREIQTSSETDDGYEVKSGVKTGERIVISGNFLLDSESRVQAGLEGDGHG